MKKAAGYSMLFGAALLCVLLLNANVARSAQESRKQETVETYSEELKDADGKVIGTAYYEIKTDQNGNWVKKTTVKEDGKDEVVTEEKGTAADRKASSTETEQADIPDQVGMNLGVKASKFVMPSSFRGGDPDDDLICALEDVPYEKHEHTIIYEDGVKNLTEDPNAFYSTDPNMKWTVEDENGNVISQDNTNIATNGGEFFSPGYYTIGNSGARQVSNASSTKTVTSQQSSGVQVFDVTCPDVWVGLAEPSENEKASDVQSNLENDMLKRIQATKKNEDGKEDEDGRIKTAGRAVNEKEAEDASKDDSKSWIANRSLLFVDEGIISTGDDNERDKLPTRKTARITTVGTLFNEDNVYAYTSGKIQSLLMNEDNYTWLNQVAHQNANKEDVKLVESEGAGDNFKFKEMSNVSSEFPGVFVKRNTPFVVAGAWTDNGDKRASSNKAEVKIVDGNGKEVKQNADGAYLFTKPNYPASDFNPDKCEYYTLKVEVKDNENEKFANVTEIALPVYIVDSHSSYSSSDD